MVIAGVIRPPPEIRAVADRTARYVAKNGRAFESRILTSAKGQTPKFAFLQAHSPFHAYYEERIHFYEQGGGGDDENEEANEKPQETKNEKTKTMNKDSTTKAESKEDEADKEKQSAPNTMKMGMIDPIAQALLTQRQKIAQVQEDGAASDKEETKAAPPPPPPLHFVSLVAPATLTIPQMETMQLVAQCTALNPPFLAHLIQQEWNNPLFAFAQPRHAHFAYFTALVDAYRTVMDLVTNTNTTNMNTTASAPTPAADAVQDSKASKESSASTDTTPDTNEQEQQQQTLIHNCLQQAAYRAEYERFMTLQQQQSTDTPEAPLDWHDFVVVETIDFAVDEAVELGMGPPPMTTTVMTSAPDAAAVIQANDMPIDNHDDEEEETIRVVSSYQPRMGAPTVEHVVDPVTGQSVAIHNVPEHVRIQLLDPKWAQERKRFQDKQKESNLVGDDVIARNLERFTQAREDLFGKQVCATAECIYI
jgi:splicing factor 3A subunit 1